MPKIKEDTNLVFSVKWPKTSWVTLLQSTRIVVILAKYGINSALDDEDDDETSSDNILDISAVTLDVITQLRRRATDGRQQVQWLWKIKR